MLATCYQHLVEPLPYVNTLLVSIEDRGGKFLQPMRSECIVQLHFGSVYLIYLFHLLSSPGNSSRVKLSSTISKYLLFEKSGSKIGLQILNSDFFQIAAEAPVRDVRSSFHRYLVVCDEKDCVGEDHSALFSSNALRQLSKFVCRGCVPYDFMLGMPHQLLVVEILSCPSSLTSWMRSPRHCR